jgi:5-methylcytosine-specific restriction endonuclease McrA
MIHCAKCKTDKPAAAFYWSRAGRRRSPCKSCVRAYTSANKARRNAASLAWAERNREITRRRALDWARANPLRRLETERRSRAENREAFRVKVRNRRAALKAAGTHDAEDVLALYDLQGGRCNGCGRRLPASYHVDHVLPVSRGGSNGPENLQLLCPYCNMSKGAKTMAEWRAQQGYG